MLCGGCTDYWEVDPGTYTLCETPKAGWVNSDPGVAPPCKEVTVTDDEFVCVPFGNWEPTEPVDEGDDRDRGVAVGGEVHQVNKVGVLAPWLILALIGVFGGSILVMIRYKTG